MRHTDIRDFTRAVPFVPFRLFLSSGETFDIHHPDMVVATPGTVHIGVPAPGDDPDAANRVKVVSLYHVVKGECLPTPTATPPATNGTP